MRRVLRAVTLALVSLALAGGVAGATQAFGPLERIPTPPAPAEDVDLGTIDAVIRGPAGRYVAFVDSVDSAGSTRRLFVRDRVTGVTELVNANDAGGDPNGSVGGSDITDDGRFVVFVAPVSSGGQAVFLRDREAKSTSRLSADGESAYNLNPDITPDGRYVVWIAGSNTNLCLRKLVLYDRTAGATTVLRQADRCGPAHQPDITEICCFATVSDDGRYVAFDTPLCIRVAGTCGSPDLQVFVHDRVTGSLEQASVNSASQPGKGGVDPGRGTNLRSRISGNGRYVAWLSVDPNLAPGDAPGYDTFVRDLQAHTTEAVSVDAAGAVLGRGGLIPPEVSTDGRFVVSCCYNVDGRGTAFIRDRLERTTTILNDAGDRSRLIDPGGGGPSISGDGACVVLRTGTFFGDNAELRAFVTCANQPPSSLRVTLTPDDTSAAAGKPIGFTLTLTNSGASTATGVEVDDPLPNDHGLEWSIASHSGRPPCEISGEPDAQVLACGPSFMDAGASLKVRLTSETTAGACGTHKNTAAFGSTNSGSGSVSASTQVVCDSSGGSSSAPSARRTAELRRKSGRVRVRLRGRRQFTELSGSRLVPLGSEVDASGGTVTVRVATTKGRIEGGDFSAGRFIVGQSARTPAVGVVTLSGGDFRSCTARRLSGKTAAPARRLRAGAGSGFVTKGRRSSTVGVGQGAAWLVVDSCAGTRTRVLRGAATVTDFAKRKTVRLRAGQTYLAG